jgi:hypothetical protein
MRARLSWFGGGNRRLRLRSGFYLRAWELSSVKNAVPAAMARSAASASPSTPCDAAFMMRSASRKASVLAGARATALQVLKHSSDPDRACMAEAIGEGVVAHRAFDLNTQLDHRHQRELPRDSSMVGSSC